MTQQSNPIRSSQRLLKGGCLLVIALACLPISAQEIIYPGTTIGPSYPSSYPTGQVITGGPYPVPSGNVIYGQPVIHSDIPIQSIPNRVIPTQISPPQPIISSLVTPARTASTRLPSTTTTKRSNESEPRLPRTTTNQSNRADWELTSTRQDRPARLASTRSIFSEQDPSAENPFDTNGGIRRPLSPYRVSMIQSARQSAQQFRLLAQNTSELVGKISIENAEFADQWAGLAEMHMSLSSRVADAQQKLQDTTQDYQDVQNKLDHYGLTPTIGSILRNKKEQLEQWQVDHSLTLFASEELAGARQKQLELEMVTHDGSDIDSQTNEVLSSAGVLASEAQQANLVEQIRTLLGQRYQWMVALRNGYQDYQEKLGELDSTTTASAELTKNYRALINHHIIWIRSGDPIGVDDLHDVRGGMSAMFDSRRGKDFGYWLTRKWKASPGSAVGLLLLAILAIALRWRAKSWLVGIGTRNRLRDATTDRRTLSASVLTIVTALAVPAIIFATARWMGTGVVSESTLHASAGLYAASLVALLIEISRQLLREFGFMHRHVDIELPRRPRAFTYLTVIGSFLVLAAYIITLMGLMDHGIWRDSIARFAFLTAMLLVAWTAHLAFRPVGGFLEPLIAKFGGSVIHRIRLVMYIVGVGFPLSMAVLASVGYGFSTQELTKRGCITLATFLIGATLWPAIKIVSATCWQMLTGAEPPPRKFDEYGEIPADETAKGLVTGTLGEHFLELKHQLAFLGQCGLVLIAIACFGWLWLDIFPSFQSANPVVWTIQDTTTESTFDTSGLPISSTIAIQTPVTLMHLLMAAGTLFVAFQLAKLLPALFDALVLQRVSFDEGMEHFSLVLGRFLLFGVGCFIACKWIGVRWQAVQWLAVGLTIGLGFGLQDMVRNLYGGFIVLFEKPARLGDFISVGRMTGRVAAQRLRTTVLSDDDGREVIVPNKNFVSEEVVNWMGAGRLSVIPIEVAVTRDERPADICRTLQELVIDEPDVLLTPSPQATLVCVAKSSQRIEIRVWIEDTQNAHRYQGNLLKTVRKFLKEKKFLASQQPDQPEIPDLSQTASNQRRTSQAKVRRRSA